MAKQRAFASGLAIGAIAGLAVGLLAAPRTGRENRRTLRKSARALPELAEDLAASAQLQADRVAVRAGRRCATWMERLRQAAVVGLAATQQELQVVAREEAAVATATEPESIAEPATEISPAGTRAAAERS